MSLQGNGSNHNRRPNLNDESDAFFNFKGNVDFERITGVKPETVAEAESAEDAERAQKLKEAIEQENSSAYEDLDDFVYRQNKKRHRSSGGRHHRHSRTSPSVLSPSHKRRRSPNSKHRHKHHFHKHHHHRRRMRRWQKIAIGILAAILSIIVIAIATLVIMVNLGKGQLTDKTGFNIDVPKSATSADGGNTITYKGVNYQYNDNITSILCMGIDKDSLSTIDGQVGTGGDADSIFVLTLDLSNGRMKLINISRDTMTDIGIYSPSGGYIGEKNAQICLAYAYGDGKHTSCHNELVSVRRLLYNVPINNYLALDIQGIAPINDSVGGVSVVSPETIAEFKRGVKYNLKGGLATSFVRSRNHSTPEANSMRMQRQKLYLESFGANVMNLMTSDLSTPMNVYNTASPFICTNVELSEVSYLAVNAIQGKMGAMEIVNVPGKAKMGKKYAEFTVDEKKLFELFLDVYYIPVGEAEPASTTAQ